MKRPRRIARRKALYVLFDRRRSQQHVEVNKNPALSSWAVLRATITWSFQAQFEALAQYLGADELQSIIDAFLEDIAQLLDQVARAPRQQQGDERARLLETLQEGAAALGFSQGAQECREVARSVPDISAALARIRGSLQLNVARSQALLAMQARNARAA